MVELITPAVLTALSAIVMIDLTLAGDNAIVIALAARHLPEAERRRAIAWGTIGAVVVRCAMTAAIMWLLAFPGLMVAGGFALAWISYRLLLPPPPAKNAPAHAATSFGGAMKTIVIADAAMGLDNVLAVAGAAQGSFLLVMLGLLISIPIVAWGSGLVLQLLERYPSIMRGGIAVLAWTAGSMVSNDPLFADSLGNHLPLKLAVHGAVIGAIFAAPYIDWKQLRSRGQRAR
jgi:YjbE family integral membrane protein